MRSWKSKHKDSGYCHEHKYPSCKEPMDCSPKYKYIYKKNTCEDMDEYEDSCHYKPKKKCMEKPPCPPKMKPPEMEDCCMHHPPMEDCMMKHEMDDCCMHEMDECMMSEMEDCCMHHHHPMKNCMMKHEMDDCMHHHPMENCMMKHEMEDCCMHHHPMECEKHEVCTEPLPDCLKLAHAYVPWQSYGKLYCPEQAMATGTLFPELFGVYPIPQ